MATNPNYDRYVPDSIGVLDNPQVDIPRIAKDRNLLREIESTIQELPTTHKLILGDARNLAFLNDTSVHLIVTSPPY